MRKLRDLCIIWPPWNFPRPSVLDLFYISIMLCQRIYFLCNRKLEDELSSIVFWGRSLSSPSCWPFGHLRMRSPDQPVAHDSICKICGKQGSNMFQPSWIFIKIGGFCELRPTNGYRTLCWHPNGNPMCANGRVPGYRHWFRWLSPSRLQSRRWFCVRHIVSIGVCVTWLPQNSKKENRLTSNTCRISKCLSNLVWRHRTPASPSFLVQNAGFGASFGDFLGSNFGTSFVTEARLKFSTNTFSF